MSHPFNPGHISDGKSQKLSKGLIAALSNADTENRPCRKSRLPTDTTFR